MVFIRDWLYKRSNTVKPWPLWFRLVFWTIVLGVIVDWIL
jgi:hypothetical protein